MSKDLREGRAAPVLEALALGLTLVVLLGLTAGSLRVAAQEGTQALYAEKITFRIGSPALELAATAAMIAVLGALAWALRAGARVHPMRWLAMLWLAVTACFLSGVRLSPHADMARVLSASLHFARGDFSPLQHVYFHNYSFQLGFCVVLEGLARLLLCVRPGLTSGQLALTVQLLNAVMSLGAAAAAGALLRQLTDEPRAQHAFHALCLAFVPMPLYCAYVYGTIPMLLLTLLAMRRFVRCLRGGTLRDGLVYAVCMALAVMLKPNAMIPLLATGIAAALHALGRRGLRPLACAALGLALSLLLPRLAVWQYELRSGIRLAQDITLLAWMSMGLQRSEAGAGWYNRYVQQFSSWNMTPEEARARILSDIRALLAQYAAAPGELLAFLRDKCFSMWLEPTYSTLWVGEAGTLSGRFNGIGYLLYRADGALRMPAERLMEGVQQAMYTLSCAGLWRTLRRRDDPAQLLLPLTVLGGFLYHMLFEAKSQYIYIYAFMLLPLAAQGLAAVMERAERLMGKRREKWQ